MRVVRSRRSMASMMSVCASTATRTSGSTSLISSTTCLSLLSLMARFVHTARIFHSLCFRHQTVLAKALCFYAVCNYEQFDKTDKEYSLAPTDNVTGSKRSRSWQVVEIKSCEHHVLLTT